MGSLNDANETRLLYTNSDDVEYDDVTEMKTSSIFFINICIALSIGILFYLVCLYRIILCSKH